MAFLDTAVKLDDIPVGSSRCVTLSGAQIGLFRLADGIYALDNLCPHRGAPLHDGFVHDGLVTCPWHQWQFRLSDGICVNIPGPRTATCAVEIRDGAIWIDPQQERQTT